MKLKMLYDCDKLIKKCSIRIPYPDTGLFLQLIFQLSEPTGWLCSAEIFCL